MPITSSDTVDLEGSYELMHFIVQKEAPIAPINGTQLTAKFEMSRLSGSGGVNEYVASYANSRDKPPTNLSISELVSTLKAGPPEAMDQERRFFDGLRSAAVISYGKDTMTLAWDNAQRSLVFRRVNA